MRLQSTIPGLVAVGLAMFVIGGGRAEAVDQGLFGRRLTMRVTAAAAPLNALLRDAVVAPTAGGADDPSIVGASLVVEGGNGETATLALPAANWSVRGGGTTFVYRNPLAPGGPSAVKRVVLKHGRR